MAAARAWARAVTGRTDRSVAAQITPEVAQQFRALGVVVEPQDIAEPETVEIWSINAETWAVFLAMRTQWLTASTMAGIVWLGLNYAVLDVVEGRHRVKADFARLQAIEAAALPILNEALNDA